MRTHSEKIADTADKFSTRNGTQSDFETRSIGFKTLGEPIGMNALRLWSANRLLDVAPFATGLAWWVIPPQYLEERDRLRRLSRIG